MILVSVVIPVYNTATGLDEMARRIEAVFADQPDHEAELIFVDDCSPNRDTWPALEAVAGEHDFVRALQLSRNFGQQAATLCGFEAARGDLVITMDDDFQHNPDDIPLLLEQADHDIVIGQFAHKKHSIFRRTTSWLKGWFDYLLIGRPKGIRSSSFRLINRAVVEGVLAFRTPHPFVPALMFHVSRDVVGVDLRHGRRREGKTGYTLRKLFGVFANLILNNSSFLLRVVGITGVLAALAGFVELGIVLYRALVRGVPVQGWASLMTAILFLGGMLLLSMGLVGEYLIRAIEAAEGKPTWLVRRKTGFELAAAAADTAEQSPEPS